MAFVLHTASAQPTNKTGRASTDGTHQLLGARTERRIWDYERHVCGRSRCVQNPTITTNLKPTVFSRCHGRSRCTRSSVQVFRDSSTPKSAKKSERRSGPLTLRAELFSEALGKPLLKPHRCRRCNGLPKNPLPRRILPLRPRRCIRLTSRSSMLHSQHLLHPRRPAQPIGSKVCNRRIIGHHRSCVKMHFGVNKSSMLSSAG